MDTDVRQRTRSYVLARQQHPAWQLLAARTAPLVLSCLQTLFEHARDGIVLEDAQQALAAVLEQHAGSEELGAPAEDFPAAARKELRLWIKRGLVIEREGRLYATDALEEALRFVAGLEGRIMTSTASRLSIVQREIESLEAALNPDPAGRAQYLQRRIAALQAELAQVEAGHVPVPDEQQAIEAIRELYNLASGLRADFRRVEDSWREADRHLRQSIVSERQHRGEIVDRLLDSHDQLLETPEGRVFNGFLQQLSREVELEQMRQRLRSIVKHPAAELALRPVQHTELRWLIIRLVQESQAVIRARARSERDVKSFLRTGLAAEHHRVGELINDILQQALHIDWERAANRRLPSPLPPVGIQLAGLPLIERLRFRELEQEERQPLALQAAGVDAQQIGDEFWDAFDSLDRAALLQSTLQVLERHPQGLTLQALARELPPTHDLETLTLWLSLAREAGLPLEDAQESIELVDRDGLAVRFHVPRVTLQADALRHLDWEP